MENLYPKHGLVSRTYKKSLIMASTFWLQVQIFYDHVNPVTRRTIDQSAGGELRDLNAEESWALLEDLSLYDNERNFMAPKSIAAISHDEREELRKKGIKSPSKLLSPKYLSPASIKELNKNPTAPKRVHFVNSIIILNTDSDTEEEDVSSTNACDLNLSGMVKGKEEVREQGTDESEFETDEEVEEILKEEEDYEDRENFNSFPTIEELTHHEWLLKNPRPPWICSQRP
ncbi:hypothetical protein Tco_0042224 [Tanacetum coccineum]